MLTFTEKLNQISSELRSCRPHCVWQSRLNPENLVQALCVVLWVPQNIILRTMMRSIPSSPRTPMMSWTWGPTHGHRTHKRRSSCKQKTIHFLSSVIDTSRRFSCQGYCCGSMLPIQQGRMTLSTGSNLHAYTSQVRPWDL